MYCVTIYNENLRKLNGDESLRITRLIMIPKQILFSLVVVQSLLLLRVMVVVIHVMITDRF